VKLKNNNKTIQNKINSNKKKWGPYSIQKQNDRTPFNFGRPTQISRRWEEREKIDDKEENKKRPPYTSNLDICCLIREI
jgi:hypothetical protein